MWDASVKHFGLRVTHSGVKTFIVLMGSGKRMAIGHFPVITLSEARSKAKHILAEKTLGRFQPQTITWNAAVEKFLENVEQNNRPRTHKEYRRVLTKYFGFGSTRLVDITRQDINGKLDRLNKTPAMKSRALTYCKTLFNWCIDERGYLEHNPCRMTAKKSPRRKRVLTDDELRQAWTAAGECGTFGMIVRLLMLTGQRRGEIAALQKSFYSHNQQTICLPSELTKNGREHCFPVGQLAQALLNFSEGSCHLLFPARGSKTKPFSGWSKSKKALEKLCPIPHWTLHDLRRTFRTNLSRLGVAPHISERLVNHVSARSEMEETYDLYRFLPEMRAAMELWEKHLQEILGELCAVVPERSAA